MATTNVAAGQKGSGLLTLTANTVETVNFLEDTPLVEAVTPLANTDDIWFTNDGTTPTVGGTNCFYLPPGATDSREPAPVPADLNTPASAQAVLKFISTGTPKVQVQRGT